MIQPGESVTLTISVYLDDTIKFKDELQIIIEEGKTFSIPLSSVGIGTTIHCDNSMTQIDFGNQFTSQTATRVYDAGEPWPSRTHFDLGESNDCKQHSDARGEDQGPGEGRGRQEED